MLVSDILVLIRNTTYFSYLLCILKLLNFWLEVKRIWKSLQGFSFMSSSKSDSFDSCFLIWMPYISFSCLITLDKSSSTTLKHWMGLPRWIGGKEATCQCRRCGFNPSVGKIPGSGTRSSILAWETPWTEDPGGIPSMGLQKSQTWLSN